MKKQYRLNKIIFKKISSTLFFKYLQKKNKKTKKDNKLKFQKNKSNNVKKIKKIMISLKN